MVFSWSAADNVVAVAREASSIIGRVAAYPPPRRDKNNLISAPTHSTHDDDDDATHTDRQADRTNERTNENLVDADRSKSHELRRDT